MKRFLAILLAIVIAFLLSNLMEDIKMKCSAGRVPDMFVCSHGQ